MWPRLSIVIPTLDEEHVLPPLLDDVARLAVSHEVIVADGGSGDRTREVAAELGARVIASPLGRGSQLAAGARAARGDVLCFLHADARMNERARGALEHHAARASGHAAVFRLSIDASSLAFRAIERGTMLRTRVLGLPYGDQGLIVHRTDYEAAGGFPDVPLMEDVAIVRALGRSARITLLDASLRVSARRWQRDGVWRGTLRNWLLLGAYLLGVTPRRLASWYRPHVGRAS